MDTIKNIADFIPSNSLVKIHQKAIEAIKWRRFVEPIVRAYQTKILAYNKWYNYGERELNEQFGIPWKREFVYNPVDINKLSDADQAEYLRQCRKQMHIHFPGKYDKYEPCALIHAQTQERIAIRNVLIAFCAESCELQHITEKVLLDMTFVDYDNFCQRVFSRLEECFKYHKEQSDENGKLYS